MRTEPRRPALGGEAEHEARLPGRGDELGAAALPLARGGDELPPNIGIGSKNCGDKALEGGATPQGIGENVLFHNRRPSPPAFALPRPPGGRRFCKTSTPGRERRKAASMPREFTNQSTAKEGSPSTPRGSVARPPKRLPLYLKQLSPLAFTLPQAPEKCKGGRP